jgi:serine/threonine-protein kinase HipA
MGRRAKTQTLTLWANGERVGRWTMTVRGEMELHYDQAWVDSPAGRPISLSLPFNLANEPLKGPHVGTYFEGLLPDSDAIRKRVAARFNTGSIEAFDLLSAIGRDCVGALQLLEDGKEPEGLERVEGVPVDDEAIERHLLEVVSPDRFNGAADPDDDFRISLAGAQEKDAFLWWEGRWLKPRGATPTTHIFKLPLGFVGGRQADFSTSVDNEWLCLKLFNAYGLQTANADIRTFGTQRVLVVERFDRLPNSGGLPILRLPQEDFCQATGTSPLLKYEAQHGPGLLELFTVLRQSLAAEQDMRTVMAAQILFWLLRAPDGHAKNFSIRLLRGNRFTLTPMYDVMSAYPVLGDGPNKWAAQDLKLAMALLGKNKHYVMHRIERRHFNSTAKKVGYGQDAEALISELIERTPDVVERVSKELPEGFSQQVADTVFGGLMAAAKTLQAMTPA